LSLGKACHLFAPLMSLACYANVIENKGEEKVTGVGATGWSPLARGERLVSTGETESNVESLKKNQEEKSGDGEPGVR